VAQPVVFPNHPIQMSGAADGPTRRVPWFAEHTDEVLAAELALDEATLTDLRQAGVIV
jgi:crotonobetainyl-CoA:carnitine CoA-transferase CaiB-like acyl-CoA transferase